MARLLFAYDHLFHQTPDGVTYTMGGKLPYSKWEEYLAFFDEVTVVSRGVEASADSVGTLAVSSGPKVTHSLLAGKRGFARLATLGHHKAALRPLVEGADAVIGRLPSEIGLSAINLAARMGKPYLIEMVGCPWDCLWNHGSPAGRIYAPIIMHRVRSAVRKAPLVHYVTREFLQRRYPTQGFTVSASNVVLPDHDPGIFARREASVKAIGARTRPVTFGTIGSMMTKLKGFDQALEAIAGLGREVPDFTYRILGEGSPERLRARAQELGIGDRVAFDGVIPGGPPVTKWLDGIDIYLQPSFQEGVPRAMIEAMNRGCLAIGSTAGGIPELIPFNRMHRPGDAAGLRSCIVRMMGSSADDLAAEVERNVETARGYSYERSLEQKNRIYSELRGMADQKRLAEPSLSA
jgi:glycosyltransferase involved in cell wall biosynthesis